MEKYKTQKLNDEKFSKFLGRHEIYKRPWREPRRILNFGIFKIHLYRSPAALGSDIFKGIDVSNPTWEEWTRKIKKVCPVQFFIRNLIFDAQYWFSNTLQFKIAMYKNKLFPKNVLKIKTLPNWGGLYRDQILHANFQILVNFVESNLAEFVDYSETEEWRDFYKEVRSLYDWWIIYVEKLESFDNTDEDDSVVEENLIRLIKISNGLY